jgi:hypothetical protein
MNNGVIILWTFAIVTALFGMAFIWIGLSSERSYWKQRDPHGNARVDATKLPTVIRNAFQYSVGEVRAPLRIAAIGVLLTYFAAIFAVIAAIVTTTAA